MCSYRDLDSLIIFKLLCIISTLLILIGLWYSELKRRSVLKKKVTSLLGAIAPLKMDILTPNKVWNMATDLLLTSGMINLMGTYSPQNTSKSRVVRKGVKTAGIWKNMISHPNYGMYECNFWHVYTIFTFSYAHIKMCKQAKNYPQKCYN